jgi:hypothetical protein
MRGLLSDRIENNDKVSLALLDGEWWFNQPEHGGLKLDSKLRRPVVNSMLKTKQSKPESSSLLLV